MSHSHSVFGIRMFSSFMWTLRTRTLHTFTQIQWHSLLTHNTDTAKQFLFKFNAHKPFPFRTRILFVHIHTIWSAKLNWIVLTDASFRSPMKRNYFYFIIFFTNDWFTWMASINSDKTSAAMKLRYARDQHRTQSNQMQSYTSMLLSV